jgi:DNA-binding transcriptional LysR family regulator
VHLSDLAAESWAIPPYDSVVGALIREAFAGSGVELPDPAVTTLSIPVNVALLRASRHISIMPNSLIHLRAREFGLKALPIVLPHRPSTVAILTLKKRTLSPVANLFMKAARELAKPLAGQS